MAKSSGQFPCANPMGEHRILHKERESSLLRFTKPCADARRLPSGPFDKQRFCRSQALGGCPKRGDSALNRPAQTKVKRSFAKWPRRRESTTPRGETSSRTSAYSFRALGGPPCAPIVVIGQTGPVPKSLSPNLQADASSPGYHLVCGNSTVELIRASDCDLALVARLRIYRSRCRLRSEFSIGIRPG
jgi:hypothetical protein